MPSSGQQVLREDRRTGRRLIESARSAMAASFLGLRPRRRVRSARRLLVPLVAAGLAVLLAPSCVITAGLHVVASPNPVGPLMASSGYTDHLVAVTATSPTNVWAAGNTPAWDCDGARCPFGSLPLMLHWNGVRWGVVALPNLSTSEFVTLQDVAAVTANDVWAVGSRSDLVLSPAPAFHSWPLLLHFNGARWVTAAAPQLPNWAGLRGVAAVSAHDIWAVGWLQVGDPAVSTKTVPLTLHFDGTVWRRVSFPTVTGSAPSLAKVAAAGPDRVYAIGGDSGGDSSRGEVMVPASSKVIGRWDGRVWTVVPMTGIQTDAELRDVAVTSTDVWVVGDRAKPDFGPLEGVAWRRTATGWTSSRPDPHPYGVLRGVHATAANQVWAAGEPNVTNVNDATDGTGDAVLLTRWDGQRWRPAFRIPAVPELRGLADVTTAGGHVFAVGGTDQTLAVQN